MPHNLKRGDQVSHRLFGICEITFINRDGDRLTIEDQNAEEHTGISPADVVKVGAEGNGVHSDVRSNHVAKPDPHREEADDTQDEEEALQILSKASSKTELGRNQRSAYR